MEMSCFTICSFNDDSTSPYSESATTSEPRNDNRMENQLKSALKDAESWSVTYDGEVYQDARKVGDHWYFRTSLVEDFLYFPHQDKVTPICKNPTRLQNGPHRPG
jgi:hypothetical protein